MSHSPVIIVHGGAGTHSTIIHDQRARESIEDGVIAAATAGWNILTDGGQALDAAEAAIRVMEDLPMFNAGYGSCLTLNGDIEMDASIMDGRNLKAGGVACIKNVSSPIHIARMVMEKTEHVLLIGDGALAFAEDHGVTPVPNESLITDKARNRLALFQQFNPAVKAEFKDKKTASEPTADSHDTVGAIVLDTHGNVAYATSTGGITAKLPGRCGDSPIVGCGGYADNTVGAVTTTGTGEAFMRTCFAFYVNSLMQKGSSPQEALEEAVAYLASRVNGNGGAIALNTSGDIGIVFNTEGMSWASVKDGVVHYGIYKGEDFTKTL